MIALNRQALRLAREVADASGNLMAGNICNTGVYDPSKPESIEKARLVNKVGNNKHGIFALSELKRHLVFCQQGCKNVDPLSFVVQEQIEWAVEEGADFILAETYQQLAEALLATKCIKDYGKGRHKNNSSRIIFK